jgi:adenylate cyclase
MKKIFTHWLFAFVTLFLIIYLGYTNPQIKEILKLKSFDLLFQSQEKQISENIVIVTIDEKSIDKFGQWPWNREVLSDVIDYLRLNDAGVIVLPILFSEEDRFGGDEIFADTIKNNFVVIAQVGTTQTNKNAVPRGIAKIGDPLPFLFEWPGMLGPIPDLHVADGVGVINTAPEVDGVTRRVPLIMRIGDETYPAMAIEVIRVATGQPSYQIKAGPTGIQAMRVPGFSPIKTDPNARIWLTWNKEYPTVSVADLGSEKLKFAGKTVIVGVTAEGLNSIIATPTGEQYDYMLSASTLDTVLSGESIQRHDLTTFLELLSAFLIGASVIVLVRFASYWLIGLSIISLYGASVYTSYYFFSHKLLLVDVTWIIFTLTVIAMHSVFNRFILEFRLKQQIRKQFEKYLDPRQVAILVKNPEKLKLGGDRKEMSFLFMDIVGFTPISEHYKNKDDPEGLVELINEFLNEVSNIILRNGGMIDKFMGDCVMAIFNAPLDMPNHAEMAIRSCKEIEDKIKELKVLYKERGLPDINVGTGVNTGTAIVGNMGSKTRLDYSVVGDAVNLAARLEATAGRHEHKDNKTIWSSYTQDQLPDTIKTKSIGEIKVKGKEELIKIYTFHS